MPDPTPAEGEGSYEPPVFDVMRNAYVSKYVAPTAAALNDNPYLQLGLEYCFMDDVDNLSVEDGRAELRIPCYAMQVTDTEFIWPLKKGDQGGTELA